MYSLPNFMIRYIRRQSNNVANLLTRATFFLGK